MKHTSVKVDCRNGQMYVIRVNGQDVGTLYRPARNSAWAANKGIGMEAKAIGTSYNKKEATDLVLKAVANG